MIIGISGRKQSGKNTVANIINGELLKDMELISDYKINHEGQLVIKTTDTRGNEGWGILDVTRKDEEFQQYADKNIWPHVKIYHFADYLKSIAINLFGLDYKKVYGNDDDKNTKTDFNWNNMPATNKKRGKLTIRDFLQYFGTDIVRKIKNNAWVESTINIINNENPEIALIPDVRFPNEVLAIKESGGFVLRLTRNVYDDKHECESALDQEVFDWNNFSEIIDNSNASIEDLQKDVQKLMRLIKC